MGIGRRVGAGGKDDVGRTEVFKIRDVFENLFAPAGN